jgi:putative ABC transport system substrate-binding protein
MIGRREFITVLGGAAAAWPLGGRAQQAGVPVIGWLSSRSPEAEQDLAAAFRKGLAETGYVEGRDVAIESHWAFGQIDRLPVLAADLLRRQPAVLLSAGATLLGIDAIRALNPTIPIVFSMSGDPVQARIVPSLGHPTGNITGSR